MTTRLLTQNIWPTLTSSIKTSKRPCHVAVAYLSQGAGKMLPLPKGSRLVVDASERTVKQGMTCPAELIKFQKVGVEIYSVPNLHAKVYVTGTEVFVGSANASQHSAATLIETLLQTNERKAVVDGRKFVDSLCQVILGPELLDTLMGMYRPPQGHGGARLKRTVMEKVVAPDLPVLRVAKISTAAPWPDDEKQMREKGCQAVRRIRQHGKSTHTLSEFRWTGRCRFAKGQLVIQILKDGDREWVCPPGHVLHVNTHPGKSLTYVHIEYPNRRRKSLERVKAQLGPEGAKALVRSGRVNNQELVRSLLALWNP
jgi:hypothetical protein